MKRLYYILKDGETVVVDNLVDWAMWFDTDHKVVSRIEIGDVLVSTVFLGLDHNFTQDGPPILFETMVFGGKLDQSQERYASLEDAMLGHERWIARVKQEGS